MWGRVLGAAVLVAGAAQVAPAVMPPYVYHQRIRESKVKAIAVVQTVRLLSTSRAVQRKQVVLKREWTVTPSTVPAVFTGHCYSVAPGGQPPVGGTIYMYPEPGARVYVTLDTLDGDITSYTSLTPALEHALRHAPVTVKPGMAGVRVVDKAGPAAALPGPAQHVALGAGLDAWPKLKRLRFTWRHHLLNVTRSYEWDVQARQVKVATDSTQVVVPQDLPTSKTVDPQTRAAHQAFLNNSYWLLFPLHMAWNAPKWKVTAAPAAERPGRPAYEQLARLTVVFPAQGGYAPGGKVVLFVDADHTPQAWAYYARGAAEPEFITSLAKRRRMAGLNLPTEFRTIDGRLLVSIEHLHVE